VSQSSRFSGMKKKAQKPPALDQTAPWNTLPFMAAPAVPVVSSRALLPATALAAPEAGPGYTLCQAVGTDSTELAVLLLNQVIQTLPETADQPLPNLVKAAMPVLRAIAPRDELEGMLAVQLLALHNTAMGQLSRAAHPDQPVDIANKAVNNATRLVRAFSLQLDALRRRRGEGQQKVTVEHVHVYSGGQAVVGAVQGLGGRGDGSEG
jgi:hypothetical protein